MNHIELGKTGEGIARRHLQNHGLTILEVNYRWKKQEIDLIAQQGEELVIVEVKTRKHTSYGAPENSITRTKQRHLIKAANAYIQERQLDLDVRFDVVSIIHNSYETQVDHIQNAFYPTL
ncbi:MAG: YraN family protein [bacterium]|nr:YraN family protein [bacterium]